MRGRKRGQRRLQDTTPASPTPRMLHRHNQPPPLRGFVPSCETSYDSIPRNRASDSMSCPVFMAGTDNPGPQPFCSIIMTFTRAGGLGYLIVRRWHGGNMPSVGTAKWSTPVRMGVPPFASISVHSRFSPSPSPTPLNQARGCAIRNVGVLPQSPGLHGSPRCPGCVSENRNNRNAVVQKHRTCRCPPQGGLRC